MTDELKAQILKLRSEGKSYRKIGAALGIPPRTVPYWINQETGSVGAHSGSDGRGVR